MYVCMFVCIFYASEVTYKQWRTQEEGSGVALQHTIRRGSE